MILWKAAVGTLKYLVVIAAITLLVKIAFHYFGPWVLAVPAVGAVFCWNVIYLKAKGV